MKSTLPASHLLGHLLLFTLTLIFLSTMARSAYVLWQFFEVEQSGALLAVFVEGLRHDLAAAALVCLIPASLGFFLALFAVTRGVAKMLVVVTLLGGLILLLVLELLTPWFIDNHGVRPDLATILSVEDPLAELVLVIRIWPMPLAIGIVLFVLVIIAFIARLELPRMLRYRLSRPSGLLLLCLTVPLCLLAIWSTPDVTQAPLAYRDSPMPETSSEKVLELSRNSLGNFLFTELEPAIKQIQTRYLPADSQD